MTYYVMDSQWLKSQFAIHPDKSKIDLARALGLEPPAVSKILNGTRQIKATEYMIMREFFGMPVDGERSLKKPPAYTIRPLDIETALNESAMLSDAEWVIPASIVNSRTHAPPEKIRMFRVREFLMEPDFRHGEHVLVDLMDKNPSPPGAFVVSDGFGHMVRYCEFIPQSNPPEVRISAKKREFQSQTLKLDDFKIIGRVIGKLQMI